MKRITQLIKEGKTLVSDGAWGTLMQEKGLKGGDCPELWNIERPDDIFEIAKSYIDAGSDMIETNSFGGSKFKLSSYGLENEVYKINKAAAEISRKAAGPDKYVLGSVGPTGKLLMMGEVTEEELYDAYKEQCMALEAGSANAILFETFTDLQEALIAIKAAKENTKCEVICTMTFDKTVDGTFFTMMGISPKEMTETLIASGVDIIGANCGNGMENMIGIVKEIREVNKSIPVLIHANAGIPKYIDGETIFNESPEITANYIPHLLMCETNIIGGCCGTTPAHIRKIGAQINNNNSK